LAQISDNALISGTVNLPEGIDVSIPPSIGSYKTIDQKGSSLVLNNASKTEIEKIGLTEKYDIQMKKDLVELAGLRAKARSLNNQISELRSTDDLTALGRKVLSDNDTEKRAAKLEELRSQLAETNIKIEEMNLKMKARTLNFSGNVYIRQ